MTVRRGTENKTENITIALNKLMEHPYLHFFAWFQFLCPYFHNSFHVRKKKKRRTRKDAEKGSKYNSRFTTVSILRNNCRLSLYTVEKKPHGGNLGYRILRS